MPPEVAPVRAGEDLDVAALSRYLKQPVEIAQFPNGHSNLVYLVRTADREYVLRRPPLGPVAPKAHDMAREYRVLSAVHPHFPEAPEPFLLCEDASVIGSTFFLMERRHGVVVRETLPPEWNPRAVGEAFIDCLVRLHAIDIATPELSALGKPEGFVSRQVRGWAERWRRAGTNDVPALDAVIRWLEQRIPPSFAPTLLHNDFKLDNVMLGPDGASVHAVLDWEMATIGDPLADVGLALCYWTNWSPPGLCTRDQFVDRYARATGRDMTHLGYHEVLGIFKLAVILQQIYYRFRCGQTNDERFRSLNARVRRLAALAAEKAESLG